MAAFGSLVLATVAAFFVTQHLKVSTPLIQGRPRPVPATISPSETGCGGRFRTTRFSFYLQHRADDVDVYVVDQSGTIVRTLASGRHMRKDVRTPDGAFPWNGREDDGKVAPDGTYYFRIALLHQGRTITLTQTPVLVKTAPPRPLVTAVAPDLIPDRGLPVAISYRGNQGRPGIVRIYRTDLPGGPRLVRSLAAPAQPARASWDGLIGGRPAPAGTYLAGLDVTDTACNAGHFPAVIPPPAGSTPHAGVTVRYLAAQPPLDPVPAGSSARAYVDSRARPYRWTLQRVGARRPAGHGSGRSFALRVPIPGGDAGLYELSLATRSQQTAVPVVARAPASRHPPGILVVLPALTWQGENPVDDPPRDGTPNTLSAGGPIQLQRPLADGLPTGFADEAGLLAYLAKAHLPYDLTTDLGLLDGTGPTLSGHRGVVLAGSERWLPAALGASLRSYVQGGGHVLSLGIDSLRRGVTVQGGRALDPTQPQATDALGARSGKLVTGSSDLVTQTQDGLGIFSHTSGALAGFSSYQPIASVVPPAQPIASAAGTSAAPPAIAGYRLGRGIVVEVGLAGFGSSLAGNVDSQELVSRLWAVLSG